MPMPSLEDPIRFAEYLVQYLGMIAAFRIARAGSVYGESFFKLTPTRGGHHFNYGQGSGSSWGFMERPAMLALTGLSFYQFFNAMDPDGDPYSYPGGFNPLEHVPLERWQSWWRQVALAVFAIYLLQKRRGTFNLGWERYSFWDG